jgi:cardiolipin synthase C
MLPPSIGGSQRAQRAGVRITVALLLLFLATIANADVFRILDDPQDAAQARVDLLQQAESEIHALYFLARNDRITHIALALLRDARRRGVPSVRLVVDANFQHIPKAVLEHLRDEGVEVRVYHPFTLRHPSWLFRRMHEKVVIVDRERYIAGGRNLAEAYFGMARKKNYVDRDVYIEGASAADADRHFEKVWASAHVVDLKVRVSHEEKQAAARMLDQALCDRSVQLNTGRNWSEDAPEIDVVSFWHDPVDEGPRVGAYLNKAIAEAKTSIVIESPYLIPSKRFLELLERKSKEGVYVQIVTNSLRSTDGLLPQAAYLKYRRRLARAGIDVREYKGPDPLHAKSAVIDGRIALIGSYNLSNRSEHLNTEVMCVADDEAVAQELLESIDAHLQNAWRIHGNGKPARRERYPLVSRAKVIRAWAARLIVPIVENQM